uniref:Uncharacterized protein n=1 Tax=Picea glauca TaxID=3330 RepID=A0A117NJE5_PICGL|nr:hypothetical protein ABT39_MTgene1228 [Picea glauca]
MPTHTARECLPELPYFLPISGQNPLRVGLPAPLRDATAYPFGRVRFKQMPLRGGRLAN